MSQFDKIKSSLPYTLAVTIIALVAFWIRILPSKLVFPPDGSVRFVSNDAWYHMRTTHLLLENYPKSIFFNPMTNYPTGSYVHFGPLFDQIIAITALILGLGHPSTSLIDHIGAYLPAVLGALTVIPVYYIGKYLRGKKTGMIAAILITFAPGQSISRSLLGFTDHHVAEVFFSTLFIMFFMLALITARRKKVTFEDVFNKKYDNLKKPLLYSIVAGVAYSAYQLVWPGAPLFIVIVMVYALVQYILNNLRKESSDYLGIVGIPTFLVSAVLVLPFVNTDFVFQIFYYSWFHVVASLCAMIGFITLSGMEKLFVKNKLNKYYYPLAIFGVAIAGILITYIFMPSFYAIIINSPSTIFGIQTGGASTIAEASSLFYEAGIFTLAKAYGNFTPTGFFASIVAIFILIANTIKKPRSQEVLALVWGVLILFAIYGQNRYAYYYSVNVSILSAFVGGLLLEKVKLGELEGKFKSTVKSVGDLPEFFKFIKIQQIVMVLVIVAVLIMPTYSYGMRYTNGGLDPNEYWMEACLWMKTNTPDPGMDYNKIYDAPKTGESFKYPDTAYGVMSWWDYGHFIEIIGHRLPNANPFQAGIGGRRINISEPNQPGAASFFTAQTEEEANKILEAVDPRPEKAGARYIMSDERMATDIFMAMPEWTLDTDGYYKQIWTGAGYQYLPSDRYFNSMEAKLHIFDGNGLKHYRMVHETGVAQTSETGYKQLYNYLYMGNIPENNTGYVKIFEYVKGANITGITSPNETIKISTNIIISQGRTFEYSQSVKADTNGKFALIVPYSTEGPVAGETNFDVAPAGMYMLSYGNAIRTVSVSEKAILDGEEIRV